MGRENKPPQPQNKHSLSTRVFAFLFLNIKGHLLPRGNFIIWNYCLQEIKQKFLLALNKEFNWTKNYWIIYLNTGNLSLSVQVGPAKVTDVVISVLQKIYWDLGSYLGGFLNYFFSSLGINVRNDNILITRFLVLNLKRQFLCLTQFRKTSLQASTVPRTGKNIYPGKNIYLFIMKIRSDLLLALSNHGLGHISVYFWPWAWSSRDIWPKTENKSKIKTNYP